MEPTSPRSNVIPFGTVSQDAFDPYHEWLGIEPSEHPVDHYRLLGVTRFETDSRKIAEAADERMRFIRTFQTGPRGIHTQRLLNELSAARLRLLDPASKMAYDDRLRAAPAPGAMEDPFLAGEDIVLPPALESPVADPMSPLVPPLAAGSANSAPASPMATSPRPDISARPRRSRARSSRRQGVSAPRSRSRHGPVWYLATFVLGTGGLAVGIWLVGNFVFPGPVRNSTEPGRHSPPDRLGAKSGPIGQEANGRLVLSAENATINGSSLRLASSGTRMVIRDWQDGEGFLSWQVQFTQGTVFRARLTYSTDEAAADGSIRVSIGERSKGWDLRFSGGVDSFVFDEFDLGISEPGTYMVTLRAVTKPGREVMRFQRLELEPRRR